MKKIFSILWGISAIVLSAISCTFAYTQEQLDAYQWAYKYGITTQPNIEAAKLNWNVTRQAFAKMVVNYLENVVWVKQTTSNSCKFTDESKITNDLRPYTKKTCAYDIMGSYWSDFRPMNPLTRAQLWTVLSRILRWDEYNNGGKWYYIYHLNMLKEKWIMNSTKNPDAYAKRWDVLVMLKRMYEKFGSNVHMNWGNTSSNIINVGTGDNSISFSTENDDDYISTVYDNSNVIYTSKDGTKYYYDDKFLNMLKDTADKKWESDLTDYLKIEAEYFKNWLDQLADLDDEDILESMWIDVDDIEPDKMTKQEKQELIKKFKIALGKVIDENKSKNNQLLKDLEKITKNIKNDKFWLKEKYSKTKTFMEASNEFLDLYSESILDLIELALMKEEGDESDEWIAQAFWLIWIALAYQWTAQEYQTYVEEWAVNTIKLLDWELSGSSNSNNNVNYSSGTLVCTLNNSDSDWINVKGVYTVKYSGEYVNLVDTIETINSENEQWIEYYKNALEETYKPYKNLKFYDYDIKTTKNTLTSKVTINYEKIDMNKFLEINQSTIFIENGKVSLEKLKSYYELIGATCE